MKKTKFNLGWTVHEGGGGSLNLLSTVEKLSKEVILPHDASIEKERNPKEPDGSGNGFFREETVHYTKEFELNPSDSGKNVWLEFEGIYQNSFVYINNSFAGQCPYGYSNFYVDATKYVHFDRKNNIKVVVKNGVPSGRWYTGGGIYRDVNLMIADRMHLVPDGIHLKTLDLEEKFAVVESEAVVEYTGTGTRDVRVEIMLYDGDGTVVAKDSRPITMEEHAREVLRQKLYVTDPKLWGTESPHLYHYHIQIKEEEAILDEEKGTFGIRKLQLDPKHGLRINGKITKLRGGCIHHDNGIIGAAEFAHAAEFRIRKLKEAGFNAVRSSHYPMSRRLLEACDKLGMLVMDEFSDVWTSSKVDYDYAMHMAKWWEQDVINLVNKDYNHPCVIMYSIGNEIPETGNRFDVKWGKLLADKIRELDDTRYTVNSVNLMLGLAEHMEEIMAGLTGETVQDRALADGTMEINSMMSNLDNMVRKFITTDTAGRVTETAFSQVDIAGYNYGTARYEMDGDNYPNRMIVGSETYPKDLDVNWELVEKKTYIIGDFLWTAWDYLGEAGIGRISYGEPEKGFYASYPYKAAYCGDFNLIGDRRPVSYWHEIIWGLRKAPYLSVQPPKYFGMERRVSSWGMTDAVKSWNWEGFEGKPVTAEVYADADEAELYVNGRLIQRKKIGETKKCVALFETVYEPGILETIVYKDGMEAGRDAIVTAKENAKLLVCADDQTIPANGEDICYVEISLVDEDGNLNPGTEKEVTVSIDGPGRILGFGSAAPDSTENYFDTKAKFYEGRLRAAVRGVGEKGSIVLTFQADGCDEAAVEIEAV